MWLNLNRMFYHDEDVVGKAVVLVTTVEVLRRCVNDCDWERVKDEILRRDISPQRWRRAVALASLPTAPIYLCMRRR